MSKEASPLLSWNMRSHMLLCLGHLLDMLSPAFARCWFCSLDGQASVALVGQLAWAKAPVFVQYKILGLAVTLWLGNAILTCMHKPFQTSELAEKSLRIITLLSLLRP